MRCGRWPCLAGARLLAVLLFVAMDCAVALLPVPPETIHPRAASLLARTAEEVLLWLGAYMWPKLQPRAARVWQWFKSRCAASIHPAGR